MAQLSYRRHRFPAEIIQQLDDKTINDDEDAVMELRMMHKVRRLHTFDLATPALSAYEALEIATLNGAKATGFAKEVGALVPGMKGDAILVDLDRVARDPWIDPEFDIAHAFVERAMGADVPTVVIGGKIVVENHRPRTIDVEGLYREVREFCAKGLTPEQRARADFLRKIKPYVQAWYGTWHETMLAHYQLRVGAGATAVIRLRLRQCHTRRRGTVRHAVCANPRGAPPRGRRVRIRPVFVQNRCLAHASWDAEVRALCHTHNVIYQAFSLLSGGRPHRSLRTIIGPNFSTQLRTVSYETSRPRSARSSSTSR
jgi:hypothetical protein